VARRIQPEALSAPKRPAGDARNAASHNGNPHDWPPEGDLRRRRRAALQEEQTPEMVNAA
jgi:hypothetical protein